MSAAGCLRSASENFKNRKKLWSDNSLLLRIIPGLKTKAAIPLPE
jgi:hypothetical protein